jgi:hypothetical protein
MSLPESENRNPYLTVGVVSAMRYQGSSDEAIAKELRFKSVDEMRAQLESWKLPDWLVGAEINSDKNRVHEKSARRLRSFGPANELPPA